MLIHAAFVLTLPIVVAMFGLSVASAFGLVLLALLWRWGISLATFVAPEKTPAVILDTISASHFVEKVRWNMDAAGIEYTENASGGTLGAYFAGRTVPRLRFRTGHVQSQIGNSAEILRYLWGAYAAKLGARAAHLEATDDRLAFEKRIDRYGANLQVWMYFHLLDDRELTLHVWGVNNPQVPAWQQTANRAMFPLLAVLIRRSFRITQASYEKARHFIEELLADVDTRLADGRGSILDGDRRNYTDYAFAAMCGLWLLPENYAAGKAETSRFGRDRMPAPMREDVERWSEDFPRTIEWVESLYANERMSAEP